MAPRTCRQCELTGVPEGANVCPHGEAKLGRDPRLRGKILSITAAVMSVAFGCCLIADLGVSWIEIPPIEIPFAVLGPVEIYKDRASPFLTRTFTDFGGDGTLDQYSEGIRFLPFELRTYKIFSAESLPADASGKKGFIVRTSGPGLQLQREYVRVSKGHVADDPRGGIR